jgi:4-amino-4-deoxy-L-arabinose transferase-like glycosyltransferase
LDDERKKDADGSTPGAGAMSALDRLESFCNRCDERYLLAAVLVLAAVLRIARACVTPILNVDAALYLFQAKALYYGEWQAVSSCVLKSVTLHPVFSSLLFALTHDWVVSLVATSILFGTLTVIPIYYTARLYFPAGTSLIVAFSYSAMYVFVTAGVDVGRDAPFWFFSACGIYFFAAGLKRDKTWLFPLSSAFFALAMWNRVEAVLFLAASPLYLIFAKTEHKPQKIAGYCAPILAGVGIIILLGFQVFHRFGEIQTMLPDAVKAYQGLRDSLMSLIQSPPAGVDIEFLRQARTFIWLLGVNIVISSVAQSFLFFYFLIFLLGVFNFGRWRESRGTLYFAVLISGAFVILYVFVMRHWFLENRYVTLFILPSFIFIGFGLERSVSLLRRFLKVKQSAAVVILVCLILASALPAQLKPEDKGKAVFRQIGSKISQLEGGTQGIDIFVAGAYFRTLHLYSNLDRTGLSCPDDGLCNKDPEGSYAGFVNSVDQCKARYVVWQEKYWPATFDLLKEYDRGDFAVAGEWSYKETGRIVLLKRLKTF